MNGSRSTEVAAPVVRIEFDELNEILMSQGLPNWLSSLCVPYPRRIVVRSSGHVFALWTELRKAHLVCVLQWAGKTFARFCVPPPSTAT